jgi:hypothetical protein
MAYATPDMLAVALETRVTPANTELLEACLEAAAAEIDHTLDEITNPPPELVVRTNVNRAVEWIKAPATYNGGVGTVDTGNLAAPASGFERHAAALIPLKSSWGIG